MNTPPTPLPQFDNNLLKSCGEDVLISASVVIKHPHLAAIGKHVAIDTGFYCTTRLKMGDYIHIAPYVTVIGGTESMLTMGHFSGLAAGVRIIGASDDYSGDGLVGPVVPKSYRAKVITAPVTIERFATVATNAVIMPGVTVAEGSVISASSLVTVSTEPWLIYAGSPARPVRERRRDRMLALAREMGYV